MGLYVTGSENGDDRPTNLCIRSTVGAVVNFREKLSDTLEPPRGWDRVLLTQYRYVAERRVVAGEASGKDGL